jgi:integrase
MPRKKRKRPHGTGSIRVRDGRAQVQWTENGRRRSKTVDLAEVQTFLARANAGLESPQEKKASNRLEDLAQTWLDGRAGMASNYDERNRWKNHLAPTLGQLTPEEVTVPVIKRLILDLRAKGLSKGTVGLQIALVSSFFSDLVEDGVAAVNPVKMLSRKSRRELKSDTDWRLTPWIKDPNDIKRVHDAIAVTHPQFALAYIIGALAGLRTGEVRALCWEHVDLGARLIHVQEKVGRRTGVAEPPKDKESRYVPITDSLYWYLRHAMPVGGGRGLVCGDSILGNFLDDHRMGALISRALERLHLPTMRWYEATRHTFGSQWVVNGGTLETLREMMGHSSVTVTERYAHLIPGNYTSADRARVTIPAQDSTHEVLN